MHKAVATAPLLENSLLARQYALETEAVEEGKRRYHRLAQQAVERGEGAGLKPCERMLLHWFRPLVEAIKLEVRRLKTAPAHTPAPAHQNLLLQIDPQAAAVITMHTTVSACVLKPEGVPRTPLYYAIGNAIVAEINIEKAKEQDREKHANLMMSAKRMTPKRVNHWARKNLHGGDVTRIEACAVGSWLFHSLLDVASADSYDKPFKVAFHLEQDRAASRKGRLRAKLVVMDAEVFRLIEEGHNARAVMRPRYLPTLVPPMPWQEKGEVPGGYFRIRGPLIADPTRDQNTALKSHDKSRLYERLNVMSSQGFRIEPNVLEVQRWLWETGGGDVDVPNAEDALPDPQPHDYKTNEQARRAWKRHAVSVHRENLRRKGARIMFLTRLGLAERFAGDTIYFPHQLDFRGRCYPIPIHLNHHGSDVCRGLLGLAEAKDASGKEAQRQLRIQAANHYGMDRLNFDDRVDWTYQQWAAITACAMYPQDSIEFWGKAEDPWQFLHACFALHDPEVAAHFPAKRDGRCNALQHYSAMLRDEVAAPLVSMTPGAEPGNVYLDVAKAAAARVAADAEIGIPLAVKLYPAVDRALVKQTVMTTVYGVTVVGGREQIRARLKERGFKGNELYEAGQYLTAIVFDSIGSVCVAATKAMNWLRQSAALIAKEGRLVNWVTPLGFPVVQPYRRGKSVRFTSGSYQFHVGLREYGKPRVSKQRQACPPNFVHSIDATHMLETALACHKAGLAFAAVHDSYWTHLATLGTMDVLLRREFTRLHERPLLHDLAEQWRLQHKDIEFPDLPELGSYDPGEVTLSPYFFS